MSAFGAEIAADPMLFRWAGDAENGAPSVFRDAADHDKVNGVEWDLANAIAKELGKEAVFTEVQWNGLIPGLQRGLYDAVVDAQEITSAREEVVNFSTPYYVTYLQLVVLDGEEEINDLNDCKGKVVGALRNTGAVNILKEEQGIEIKQYDYEMSLLYDLIYGRIDAVLFDAPIALYYAEPMKGVRILPEPIGRLVYGVAINKKNTELLAEVNAAIARLIETGKLREIYERWNMWNPMMANYLEDYSVSDTEPTAYEAFKEMVRYNLVEKDLKKRYLSFLPVLGKGAWMTIKLSVISMIFAMFFGLFLAIVRIYGHKIFSGIAYIYIEIIRGTPLLIQLYFIFYGLPAIGIKLDSFVAGILGLGLNYAAFEAENYRAGIRSVPQGQMEAARALGMTHWQSLRFVVLPQAVRTVIPPITNDFISLLKDSALVSVITIVDLTYAYTQLAAVYYDYFGIGILVAGIYFLIGFPFAQLGRWAEKKLSMDRRRLKRY